MAGRKVSVDLNSPSEEAVFSASSVLTRGGVVLYPSDTVYGLMADSSSRSALSKITKLKGYTSPRPFIVLVGSIEKALQSTKAGHWKSQMERYWPGPVTLLLPDTTGGKIALRVPADPLSVAILNLSGVLPVSTSANLKGQSNPSDLREIPDEILSGVDLILDGGVLLRKEPSAMIDLTGDKPKRIR